MNATRPVPSPPRRGFLLGLAAMALLAGCENAPPPPQEFPLLSFDYLPKLSLNVATVDIEIPWQPGTLPDATHVESLAPEKPVDALKLMLQQRLIPVGGTGRAVALIEDASLVQRPGQYQGTFQVRLNIFTSDGAPSGFAKAYVTGTRTIVEDSPEAARAALYELTKRMMRDMNAELEFQIRRSLRDYLQSSAGAAPLPQPVQTQSLTPAAAPPAAPTPAPAAPPPTPLTPTPLTPPPQ